MKKSLLFFLLFINSCLPSIAESVYDSLEPSSKKFIMDTISVQEKLKTCTPGEITATNSKIKIYGITNGICRFQITNPQGSSVTNNSTGEKINTSNCDYKVPLSTTRQYAEDAIKMTKALYQIDGVTMSPDEMKAILNRKFNLERQYCK